jgi:superfamily II DNA or RNA helicase
MEMDDVPPNRLCAALSTLAPGRVLQMGTLKEVQQGIKGFAAGVVKFDKWLGRSEAKFMAGAAPVSVSVDDAGKPRPHCEPCDASACAHVVAVMATCVHVIRGKSAFTTAKFRQGAFEEFRDMLMEPFPAGAIAPVSGGNPAKFPPLKDKPNQQLPSQKLQIRIVQNGIGQLDVVCNAPRISLSMRGNASYASPAALRLLPASVRDLFSVPVMNADELEQDFFSWAKHHIDDVTIMIDTLEDIGVAPVEIIIADAPMVPVTSFRRCIETNEVEIQLMLARANPESDDSIPSIADTEKATVNFYKIGRSMAYFPEDRALAFVALSHLWEARQISDYAVSRVRKIAIQIKNRPFTSNVLRRVPLTKFNLNAIDFDPGLREEGLVRYLDGDDPEPVVPAKIEAATTILAEPTEANDGMELSFRFYAGSQLPVAIDGAADYLEEAELPFASSHKRKVEFRSALGAYAVAADDVVRLAVEKNYFDALGNSSRLHYEAEQAFSALRERLSVDELPVFANESSEPEVPAWVTLDPDQPAFRLLGLVFYHFPGLDLRSSELEEPPDDEPMTECLVTTEAWVAGLPAFAADCVEWGIQLLVSGCTVERVSLDLKIRAESVIDDAVFEPEQDRIDWFALKPEVICGDRLVPHEHWMELIKSGAITSEEGGILQVLDPESLERFALFLQAGAKLGGGKATDKGGAVRVPRLEIFDWMHLKSKGISVELPAEEAAMMESLLAGKPSEPAPMPDSIHAELRPYQEAGYRWLAFLYEHRFGAVLADDMGLGKTLQTITLIAALKDGLVRRSTELPHLAVLPPSLVFNWQSEIERFAPHLKVYEYTGAKRSLDMLGEADIALTTYELARRDIEELEALKFDVIIFDEAQTAKNISAARSKAIRRLSGRFRLCLTGTPLENHIGEYFAILDLALPGLLGEPEDFRKAMRNRGGEAVASSRYLRRSQPFVLRRTKEKVLKDLPPKVESDIYLELDRAQKEYYTRTVAEVRNEVAKAFKHKPRQQAGIVALTALMRLRQICVAPSVIDPSIRADSPKVAYLVEKLRELHDESYAALVFSQFTRVLDVVEKQLRETGLESVRLDGQTPQKMRKQRVAEFQSEDGPGVFLISLKAGGAGLNLTRAAYVFHLDPWWNPAVERQASDRAHRIGQKQTVFIHRILMKGTIEEKMMVLKARKQELYDEIMGAAEAEGDRVQTRKSPMITQEDIGFLLE